ncbi:hypothetical protein VDGD_04379 [Verticillium dahliae]|nr:hypothetical protein VdG1_01341 [Verticillium dahliae VDG1]RBQ74947.1 hypothetical protein VDGD_04379 [Verticillium dahliae]
MAMRDKMPAPLDLSRSKIFTGSPRMNLRRAASYNNDRHHYDKAPLSSTSSRFNFNHLLFTSPPPSPSLPALVPRPRRSPTHPRPSRMLRGLLWLTFFLLIFYFATITIRGNVPMGIPYLTNEQEFEMIGQDDLPDFATPIIVTDTTGRSKWTVSIPPDFEFPLGVEDYGEMVGKCREVASRVRDMRNKNPPPFQTSLGGTNPSDKYFIDVPDAEKAGLLPGLAEKTVQASHIIGETGESVGKKAVCESTMTFVLETADAGLGNTLMELWLFYGLALKQGRSFFIDDSRWAYGKYTDIFQPPPVPNCLPPPRHQMLPCPTQARHLVVTSATARSMWADSISKPYPRQGGHGDSSVRELYDLARAGYEALFKLNTEDAKYAEDRMNLLARKTRTQGSSPNNGMVVGVHVRHGDCHPLEYQYRSSYIPINAFTDKARHIIEVSYQGAGRGGQDDVPAQEHSLIVMASDDPMVYESDEFRGAHQAQDRIRLAGKQEVQKGNPNPRVMHHFVDDSFGWEGGFFAPMFWSLGQSGQSPVNGVAGQTKKPQPTADAVRLRSYIGRAYMLDLAVLSGSSDVVICTVSAMGCRLLAVMMGWERAMEKDNWVNVDGDYGWTALSW